MHVRPATRPRRSHGLAGAAVVVALLAVTAAAQAAPNPSDRGVLRAPRGVSWASRLLPPTWRAGVSAATPLRGVLPGPYTVSGTALDYDGTPLPDDVYGVEWGWYDPNLPVWISPDVVYHVGADQEVVGGAFSFADVTSVPGNDSLTVYGDPAVGRPSVMSTWNNDFSTAGPFTIRPGRVQVDLAGWPAGQQADVTVGDAATGMAESTLDGSGLACTPHDGFNSIEVRSYDDKGAVPAALDWTSPDDTVVAVTPGATLPDPIALDWSQARRGRLTGPVCRHSGRPGTVVEFRLDGWPAGYEASFYGSSYADGSERYYTATAVSSGPGGPQTTSLRVPTATPVGDAFELLAYRTDDSAALLQVSDLFQVCTFSATRSTIARHTAIRLQGNVAPSARVDVFRRFKVAKQPWTLAANGWTKVDHVTSRADGKFSTRVLRPTRTAWYVARYTSPYFPAFTSVVKVRVR